jgi:hypothetical protein
MLFVENMKMINSLTSSMLKIIKFDRKITYENKGGHSGDVLEVENRQG